MDDVNIKRAFQPIQLAALETIGLLDLAPREVGNGAISDQETSERPPRHGVGHEIIGAFVKRKPKAGGALGAGEKLSRVVAGEEYVAAAVVTHGLVDIEQAAKLRSELDFVVRSLQKMLKRTQRGCGLFVSEVLKRIKLTTRRGGKPDEALINRIQQKCIPIMKSLTNGGHPGRVRHPTQGRIPGQKLAGIIRALGDRLHLSSGRSRTPGENESRGGDEQQGRSDHGVNLPFSAATCQ